MSWRCSHCDVEEDGAERGAPSDPGRQRIDAVCHHCGALLCPRHRHEVWDTAFLGTRRWGGRWAVHCDGCRRTHHRFALGRPSPVRP